MFLSVIRALLANGHRLERRGEERRGEERRGGNGEKRRREKETG